MKPMTCIKSSSAIALRLKGADSRLKGADPRLKGAETLQYVVAVSCGVLFRCVVASQQKPKTCIKYPSDIALRFKGAETLQCVAVCCSVLQCVAVCCSVLQWGEALCCCSQQKPTTCIKSFSAMASRLIATRALWRCSVLQWVALGCSVLHFVVSVCCCSELQSAEAKDVHAILRVHCPQNKRYTRNSHRGATRCNTLQHAATRCNALKHAATRCNTLQHAATRCTAAEAQDLHQILLWN